MKDALLKGQLYKLTAIPVIITALFLFFFLNNALIHAFSLDYLLLFMVVFLLLSKYSKTKFTSKSTLPVYSYIPWLVRIFAIEIVSILLFISISSIIFTTLPAPLHKTINFMAASNLLMNNVTFQWGLFPWCLYAIVATSIGYTYFNKQTSGLLKDTAAGIFINTVIETLLGPACDFLVRISNLFIIGVIIGLTVYQIIYDLNQLFHLATLQYYSIATLFIGFFLYWITRMRRIQKLLISISQRRIPISTFIFIYSLILIMLVVSLNSLIAYYELHHGRTIPHSAATKLIQQGNWQHEWLIFSWAWWILATPTITSALVYISQGRSIRTFICGILLLPFLLSLTYVAWHSSILPAVITPLFTSQIASILGSTICRYSLVIFNILIIYFCLRKPEHIARIDMGMLPPGEKTYFRRPGKTIHNILACIIVIFSIFAITWMQIFPAFALMMAAPLLIPIGFSCFNLCFNLANDYD